ncbi:MULTISPECIES: hypothetical protein [Saccharothrix]|uniref:hypothetical protein n=1 Tax=Saccharothrix TaxID=2071 RepID=UPI00093FCF01|nr:hypothetical protein [Saccharothrix sp. CB00851]OKI25238.1 hypothetical protein A6A25_33170 [Saccharothrix sp. CB00851]
MDLFVGLDDVDWSSLTHAYGPAVEVPELVRGLVSGDPAVRESALDDMYGAVHHQGSVFDSTIAAIPFLLEVAGRPGLPGRAGVVEYLASIGDPEEAYDEWGRRAVDAVADAFGLLAPLLEDPEPAVRKAACEVYAVCRADAGWIADALGERQSLETDTDVQTAIVAALGRLGARLPVPALVERLSDAAARHPDPSVRLTALVQLAEFAPDALPDDVPTVALAEFTRFYAAGTPTTEPAGFTTPTLIGELRVRAEEEASGRRAPGASRLLADLSGRLGDRVEDRTRLLVPLLESADWEPRLDAVRVARYLVEAWRGDHREVVRLIGEQLLAPEPRLPPAAASALKDLGPVAAPAADSLARSIETAPPEAPHTREEGPPAWITTWESGSSSTGPTVRALAALGDPRALVPVRWALERREPPDDIGHVVRSLGPLAVGLLPLVRARLRRDSCRGGLLLALGELGEAAAPAVPDIVRYLPESGSLNALRALGAHATRAARPLRRLLDHDRDWIAIAAAAALWRVEGDADRVLPTLLSRLDHPSALELIAELGPAAAPHLPALRTLLDRLDPNGWYVVHVAEALWRAAGDAEAALPLLTAAWHNHVHIRVRVARCLAEMGHAAAPAAPLLREELARPRRHTTAFGRWGSDRVLADEELLRLCRDVLAGLAS